MSTLNSQGFEFRNEKAAKIFHEMYPRIPFKQSLKKPKALGMDSVILEIPNKKLTLDFCLDALIVEFTGYKKLRGKQIISLDDPNLMQKLSYWFKLVSVDDEFEEYNRVSGTNN